MVSVITAAEIRNHGWRTLADALSSLRGLHLTYDRSYAYLGVRGFGRPGDFSSRILLLVNGVTVNDAIYDQASVGGEFPIDMTMVERIEFVPGAGSVMYGGNALLAVVNVVTRSGASVGRKVEVGAGSGRAGSASASIGWRDSAGNDALLAYSGDGRRGRDLRFESYAAVGADPWSRGLDHERNQKLLAQFRRGGFAGTLILQDRIKGLPGGPFGIDLNDPASRVRDRHRQAIFAYDHQVAPELAAHFQGYGMEVLYNGTWMYSGIDQPDGMVARSLGGDASFTFSGLAGHTMLAGVSLRRDLKRRQFNISMDADFPRRSVGVFVQDDVKVNDHLSLSFGLRHDDVRDKAGFRHLSPRFAAILRPRESTVLKLITGAAFRPPNAFETDYVYAGTNAANPDLRAERNHTTELGVIQDLGRQTSVSASLFATKLRDLISIERDSATSLQKHFNRGSVRTRGLELETSTALGRVSLRGSLSFQRTQHESGAAVANTPGQLAKLLIQAPLAEGLRLGWETHYLGRRTTDSGRIAREGIAVGGFAVSHAVLSGDLGRDVGWDLSIGNVFDRQTRHVVGTEFNTNFPGTQVSSMDQMIQDGRNFIAHLRWRY